MDPFDALVRWYRLHARRLPWRGEPRDPYRVLVSEAMLQQTQVERVVPRFLAFLERFPSLEALAEADESEVVEAWSGLGYYRRARLLHGTARAAAAAGGLPAEAEALARLPGIGPYTAAAIASLAFGLPEPVLDGNVVRVGSRVLALAADPRGAVGQKALTGWVRRGLAGRGPGEVNEALMELGATVCTPRRPGCGGCPLGPACAARAAGTPEAFPRPRAARPPEDHLWVAACAVDPRGMWLLRRIDVGPILRGLWLPPFADLGTEGEAAERARALLDPEPCERPVVMGPVRHGITFRRIRVVPVRFAVRSAADPGEGWRWADPRSPGLPTSSLLAKLYRRVTE